MVDHDSPIALVASSEDNDLEVFSKLPQTLYGVGTDVDPSFGSLTVRKHDRKHHIVRNICVFVAMDQGFIEIEYYSVGLSRFGERTSHYILWSLNRLGYFQQLKRSAEMVTAQLRKRSIVVLVKEGRDD